MLVAATPICRSVRDAIGRRLRLEDSYQRSEANVCDISATGPLS